MSKYDYKRHCASASGLAREFALKEVSVFCKIIGLPDNVHNYLIGDDPHGVVDIQEGYMVFDMSDIHVVLAGYEKWLEVYKSNEGIAKAVRQWYYWTLAEYEKTHKTYINLSSWLRGLRPMHSQTLPEYREQKERELFEAQQRVEALKKDLKEIINEHKEGGF